MKIFPILLLLLSGINSYSKPVFVSKTTSDNTINKKKFDIRLSTNIKNTSTRFDNNSNEIIADTLIFESHDTTTDTTTEYKLRYITDFEQQKYNLHIGYIGLENFYVYATLPFVNTKVTEKFAYDTNMVRRMIRNKKSDTYFEGINFDMGYTFHFEKININLMSELFVPFGNWNAPLNLDTSALTDNKWINLNRKFELNLGTTFDIKLNNLYFQIGGLYNYRGGNFSDRIFANFLVALSNIKNTEIFANLKYKTSLTDYKEEYAVSFWEYPIWSKTLAVEVGFKMFFTDAFYINVGYDICFWAKNSLAKRSVNINAGYLF